MNNLDSTGIFALICFLIFSLLLGRLLYTALKNQIGENKGLKTPKKGSIGDSIIISTMPADTSAVHTSAAVRETPKAPPAALTLDELFAASNNMWVCEYCETINLNSSNRCVACGHSNKE